MAYDVIKKAASLYKNVDMSSFEARRSSANAPAYP
jgi:hypothetical protein